MEKKISLVYWKDIAGITSGDNSNAWNDLDECKEQAEKLYNNEYTTVGEIIEDNDRYIIIAGTTDNDHKSPLYSDASMIMKSVIIRIDTCPLK